METQGKNISFKCEKCSDKFSGLESLKGHLGEVHGFCFNVKARNSSFSIWEVYKLSETCENQLATLWNL